jgi:ABC-2 type transport system ATP-binding protein
MNVPDLSSFDPRLLLLIVPLVLLEVGLLVWAIADLLRGDRRVRGDSKPMWALIIVLLNGVGPILYLLAGRVDGPPPDESPAPGAMPGWGSPHDPPIAVRIDDEGSGRGAPPSAASRGGGAITQADDRPLPGGPAGIELDGLVRRYPGGILALDRLSLSVPAGSVFGLLGPNGAGKTTTLRILAGLGRPTAGRALVHGVPVAADAIAVRRSIGFLGQEPKAYGWMTGREQVRLLGRLHGLRGGTLEDAVSAALQRVELAGAADRRAGTYSGGMRQRLGIAGALVHRPPVVILDEPVSALDPEGRRDVLELIAALRGTTTVLFSSHVLADVERICDRVGILDHGRLVAEGPLDELLERYARPVWRIDLEPGQAGPSASLVARLRAQPWVTAAELDHGRITVVVADAGQAARDLLPLVGSAAVAVIAVSRDRPTLEDVFLQLTGSGEAAA